MKIFGKDYEKEEIIQKVGDITQLGGIKYYEFIDGVSRGVRAIDVKSPCGLDFTVLPDRGMDISNFYYKSVPIAWRSAVRETSPVYYESKGVEWLRTFFGGLVTTCGLTTMGFPSVDNGEELGLHGRISNTGAENILTDGKWENGSYVMQIKGTVREVKVFGDKLEMDRKITTWMDKPKMVLEDTVTNIGHNDSPVMVLYHINIGFPVVDSGSVLLEGKAKVTPRDKVAEDGAENFNKFTNPLKDYQEKVYFHDIVADGEGNSNIAIANEGFNGGQGIGIWLKFNKDSLPLLTQWKQLGMGEYTCGIEPCNSFVTGRKNAREDGTLKFIKPGKSVKFRLEFNILESVKDINEFRNKYS